MFTISSKGSYGLAAVLGFALQYGKGPVQIKNIAEEYKIPQHYLEQLLVKLKNGGIMKSFRGAYGGYSLAKKPSDITVLEVLKCLEGENILVNNPGELQVLQNYWLNAKNQIEEVFEITIEDLVIENTKIVNHINFEI